jgi:hypothetical protein
MRNPPKMKSCREFPNIDKLGEESINVLVCYYLRGEAKIIAYFYLNHQNLPRLPEAGRRLTIRETIRITKRILSTKPRVPATTYTPNTGNSKRSNRITKIVLIIISP